MKRTTFLPILTLMISIVGYVACTDAVFFAPDDRPKNALIDLINKSRVRIYGAIYMLTEPDIIKALQKARMRGVDVQIIVDGASLEASYNKALANDRILPLFSYGKMRGNTVKGSGLMHHKFALIDNCVVTGSFNWTRAANTRNQENLVITENKELYRRFDQQFAILKSRCTLMHSGIQGYPQPLWQRVRAWCRQGWQIVQDWYHVTKLVWT